MVTRLALLGLLGLLLAGCGDPVARHDYTLAVGETLRYAVTVDESFLAQHRLPLAVTDPNRVEPEIRTRISAQVFITATGMDSDGTARVQCGYDSFLLTAEAGTESTCIGFAGDTVYFYNRAGFALAVPEKLVTLPLPTARRPWPATLHPQRGLQFDTAYAGDTFAALLACWRELFPPVRTGGEAWTETGALPAPAPADRAPAYVRQFRHGGWTTQRGRECLQVSEASDNDLAGMRYALPADTFGLVPAGTDAVFSTWHEQRTGSWWLQRLPGNRAQNPAAGDLTVTHAETVESVLPDPLAASGTERFARTVQLSRHIIFALAGLPPE